MCSQVVRTLEDALADAACVPWATITGMALVHVTLVRLDRLEWRVTKFTLPDKPIVGALVVCKLGHCSHHSFCDHWFGWCAYTLAFA